MTLHVFNQTHHYPEEGYSDSSGAIAARPRYFPDSVYSHAASLLGLDLQTHAVGYVRKNFSETLRLSLGALSKIRKLNDDLAIIWQGYGVYAALANLILGKRARFILNTYKTPGIGSRALRTTLNDVLLKRAIETAVGVVAISCSQADMLRRFNPRVLWLPFASDANWWTPATPDINFLSAQGIGCRKYVLVMGDVNREEDLTLRALGELGHPILRVTRDPHTARVAREIFGSLGINGNVLANIPFSLLRELYRGAHIVVVPARSEVHPAGMTSLTEAMCCGRPVLIPAGITTIGYVQDKQDAFVLDKWEASAIRDLVCEVYESDVGEKVGKNARKTVDERLNFSSSARRLAEFIATLSPTGKVQMGCQGG